MEINKEEFKKKYPKISKEMEKDSSTIKIKCVKPDLDSNKNDNKEDFRRYNPSVIDFIRRFNTFKEADSIISYMEKRGEISPEKGKNIRMQIKEKGIRSLGSKKKENYYFEKSKRNSSSEFYTKSLNDSNNKIKATSNSLQFKKLILI